MSRSKALFYGTVAVGTLDLLDAFTFFAFRDVAPVRILQSIASGLLGRSAFEGGLLTASLGGVLHYCIAFFIVTVYFISSSRLPALIRSPLIFGPLYGLVVYSVMNFVVVPLSAAASGAPVGAVLTNGLLIHVLGVGLPSALFARAAAASSRLPDVV